MPLILFLSACASQSTEFFGASRHDIEAGGLRFTVFHLDRRAEVIRHGYVNRAARDKVPGLMVQAVETATGCAVRPGSFQTGLPGDTGVARVALNCP
ncbi:MAG: hypothetical protein Q4G36_07280 [Paracoccus sp. (in: a-proteobacteria)]|nr:hypothetical protein [Paracoccus sp. (in: a-proteobacteria)]